MKKGIIIAVVIGIIAVICAIVCISSSNSLASANNTIEEKAAEIDTQLQRRADLIPNLIATVKEYTDHETEVFDALAQARSNLIAAKTMEEKAVANNEIDSALGRLFAVAEAYPELTSNTLYVDMMDELAGTENRIAYARGEYNSAVGTFNRLLVVFPTSLFAGKYDKAVYFEASETATEVPTVQFD